MNADERRLKTKKLFVSIGGLKWVFRILLA
jgi:hypothetical protein